MLAFFAIVSYLAWLKVFGIYRYLAALEVVSGALIVGCVMYLARRGVARVAVVVALTALLVGTTRPGGWGREPFEKRHFFDVVVPEVSRDSLVILGYTHPLAYVAPFFPSDARFVSPHNNFIGLGQKNRLARRAEELVRGHRGPLYLLQYEMLRPGDKKTLDYFDLTLDRPACRVVRSSMDTDAMRLCPLRRNIP